MEAMDARLSRHSLYYLPVMRTWMQFGGGPFSQKLPISFASTIAFFEYFLSAISCGRASTCQSLSCRGVVMFGSICMMRYLRDPGVSLLSMQTSKQSLKGSSPSKRQQISLGVGPQV